MDLLRKLYTSRCSPPGLGEEGRFHFVIKAEEVMTPVHPFVIREKTKMYLGKGEGGSGRMIQVPVGVGKGTVEEFVKFLYLEQLDKNVGIKEERQLLRLAVLKELKLKREYQEKLVEIIDAFKIEGQNIKRDVDNNAQGSGDGQSQSRDPYIPKQEVENIGDIADADQGKGGFQSGDDNDDGDVIFIEVINGERSQSPAPSHVFPTSNDADAQEERPGPIPNIGSQEPMNVDRGHNLRYEERRSNRNIPSRTRPRRVSRLKCKRCRRIFCSIIALEGHVKGFHKESRSGTLPSSNHSNPRRRSLRSCSLKENLTGDVENVHEEDAEIPDISTSTMNHEAQKKKKGNKNPTPCPTLSNRSSASGGVKCMFCTDIFQNYWLLEVHTRNHTKERPYRCQKCDQSFTEQLRLIQHLESSHTNFRCETCKKTFPTKNILLIHLKDSHKTYGCSQCEQIFNSKEQMDNHVARVHEGKIYNCTICKKSYTTKGTLKNHCNGVHKKLRYPCPHCDMSYAWPTTLAGHIKKHGIN